jgi:hypothetical protein
MQITINLSTESVQEVAMLFNTLSVLEKNRKEDGKPVLVAGTPTPQTPAATAPAGPAPAEAAPAKRTRAPKAAAEPVAESAAEDAEPAPEGEKLTREEALAYLRAIAEARSINGPSLISFLKDNFGVPKFSEIPVKRWIELKTLAANLSKPAEADPLA